MVREDANVLIRFARYYARLGAHEILLYFDGTPPADLSADIPCLRIIACDAAFWSAQPEGARPPSVDAAQGACYRCARAAATADWLWITDADEFLVTDRPVAALLADIPADIDVVRIRTAEAVWGPGDDPDREFGCTYFRRPLPRRLAWILEPILYGRQAVFFRAGLVAHSAGKHFLRRESSVTRIGNHTSYVDERPAGVWADAIPTDARRCFVAHFDAVSFPRWREKWRRRYSAETATEKMHPVRHAQKEQVRQADAAGADALRALFLQLNTLKPWQSWILKLTGHLARGDIFAHGRGSSS